MDAAGPLPLNGLSMHWYMSLTQNCIVCAWASPLSVLKAHGAHTSGW